MASDYRLIEHAEDGPEAAAPLGRLTAFHGQMGMFVRALAYMMSHGADGIRQASEDAVLNANYVRACLGDVLSSPFGDRACMHEALFDDRFLKGTHVSTLDFAKALIDEGFHPMTVYFPLVVSGAMLVEPTESESKQSLDQFISGDEEAGGSCESRRFRALLKGAALRSAEASRRNPGRPRSDPYLQARFFCRCRVVGGRHPGNAAGVIRGRKTFGRQIFCDPGYGESAVPR